MSQEAPISILDGSVFVVSDGCGDIEPSTDQPVGFFSGDTRFLSRWVLTIDGNRLQPLSIDNIQYFEKQFFLVPGPATHYVDAKLSVLRRRWVEGVLGEEITLLNHDTQPVELTVRVDVASDFADLFEIKDVQPKKGEHYVQIGEGRLRLGYRRETFRREAVVSTTEPARVDEGGLTYTVRIGPHEQWRTTLRVDTAALGFTDEDLRAHHEGGRTPSGREELRRDLAEWIARAPELHCENEALRQAYRVSLTDLAALRFTPLSLPGERLPAAGLPWFMTIFGRDSIFTSLQALPFAPELARTTLRVLAALQGSKLDDFREEEPGKILHEMRYGETAAFEEQPHSPYYGAADSTCLFVILLDEYERWTGDADLVRALENNVRAAIDWIDTYADLMGNGYVWYQRRNERTGLENQCWKDSWDAIAYADGRLPDFPRATCELQGYAYDAKVRAARLARDIWQDPAYAQRLEAQAADLKARFNRDFWVADGEFYALALDREGRHVDSLTSNNGHLLWSGIVEPARARAVADHLVGPRLFSGWGVRTMAVGDERYNPIGYHVGTVWPFDTSFVAWGLRRYGFLQEAARVADGMLAASAYFNGRLPEAFAGYERQTTHHPVEYPTACSPQAWSAGTPLLLRTMLGLEPHEDHLAVSPAPPIDFGHIELRDIPGRWGLQDAFGRDRSHTRRTGRAQEDPSRLVTR